MRYIFLFIILVPSIIFSQIVTFNFNNCSTSPTYILPGFASTNFTTTAPLPMGCSLGCAIDCSGSCPTETTSFLTNGWNTVNINLDKYYEFTVSSPGVSFYLSNLFFVVKRSSTGPINASIYLDGTSVSTISIANNTNCQMFGAGINQNRSGSANLKIFFWGASNIDGTIRLDNVSLNYTYTTLPVELIHFNGFSDLDHVNLFWTTATETNNSHFDIERSYDGLNFHKISSLDGFGSSQSLIEYKYQDFDIKSGVIYYRLKQFDFDGKYNYSDIISINVDSDFSIIDHVIYYNGQNEARIYDLYGQLIWDFDWGKFSANINTLYFVRIGDKNTKLIIK